MTVWRGSAHAAEGEERTLLQVLDDLSLAIFVIDPELRVLELNAAARMLVAHDRGIGLIDGSLRVTRPALQEAFLRAIGQAVATPSPSPGTYGISVGSANGDGPGLHVCVRALAGGPAVARGSRIAVYVIDPHHQPALDEELLRRVYRFSRAEIRVVNELMQGHTVESIAELFSLSVYTVRTHLKNVFAKTGTNRQGELIGRIAASLGGIRRRPADPETASPAGPGLSRLGSLLRYEPGTDAKPDS